MKCRLCKSQINNIIKSEFNIFICECGMVQIPNTLEKDYYNKQYDSENRLNNNTNEIRNYKLIKKRLEKHTLLYGNILDIGSGFGFGFKELKNNNNILYAIEPSNKGRKELSNNNIVFAGKTINKTFNNQYDIIIFRHVLEHLENPLIFFQNVKRLLKKGGLIYFSVPNLNNPNITLNHNYFKKQHLNYFTKTTLNKLVINNDFKIIKNEEDSVYSPFEIYYIIRK